ncbi:MAG: hypothetical protein M1820_000955 [Bogoriella megaspora]|nr:MAG: hypothetical protein M1820_000955 [Bogoriella megaspora]
MADHSDLISFWHDAVKAYEQEAEHSVTARTAGAKLNNADDLLALVEQQGQSFKDFRNRHGKLWSCLKRVLDPVTTIGNLITSIVGTSQIGAPATIVLGSVMHLLMSCQEVTNAYDWLQTVFAELEEFAQRLQSYSQTEISDALRRKIVAILAFILRIIGRSETLIRRNRFREYLRVTFIGKDEKTKALVEDLNKLLANEQRLVVALTYEKTSEIAGLATSAVQIGAETRDVVVDIQQNVSNISDALNENAAKQINQAQLENLRAVLKTSAVEDTDDWYSLLKKSLLQGSGAWLQREAFFEYWMQQQALVLWVFGGPGAGKSMLSAWLISLLLSKYESSTDIFSGTSVGYFFIKESKESLRNPNSILKTFAWQLQQTDPLFRKHAAVTCEISRNTARAEDTWENLFLDYFQPSDKSKDPRKAILIIDGLDEADADARRRLLQLMKTYVSRVRSGYPHRIQFAVFGRTTLRSDLKSLRFDTEEKVIEVSSIKNEEDMRNYIDFRLKKLSIVQAMRTWKQAGSAERAKKFARGIRKKVLEGADGVFLWSQLLLDQIEGKDEAQINRILSNPPQDLYDMIHRVFDRLSRDPEMDLGNTKKILAWISFAQRELKFGEIDIILRLDSRTTNWLLWDHLRDKFSSVLRFRYPRGYDPDAVPQAESSDGGTEKTAVEDQSTGPSEEDAVEQDHGQAQIDNGDDDDFDFGEDSDEDADNSTLGGNDQTSSDTKDSEPGLESEPLQDDVTESKSTVRNPVQEADDFYDWNKRQTKIDFTHHRFREYLKLEGDRDTQRKKALPINIDVHKVQLELAVDCFKMLRLGIENGKLRTNQLLCASTLFANSSSDYYRAQYFSYPGFYLFDHLEKIDVDRIEEDHKNDEDGCKAVFSTLGGREDGEPDMFWHLWLGNRRKTSVIQKWLGMAGNLKIDSAKKSWASLASTSFIAMLKPLAMTAAKIWLTKKGYDDDAYTDKSEFLVWFLKGYRSLSDTGEMPEPLANFNYSRDLSFYDFSAAEIEDLAEWAGLEKTTHWYTGVGWILYEACETDRALEILGKAIEMDSDAWVPMEATARAYGEDKEDYQKAIEWMDKALEFMPKYFKDCNVDAYLLQNIAGWKQALGDTSGAFELAKNACINSDEWEWLIYVLRYLEDWNTGNEVGAPTYLIQYLSDYSLEWGIGWAIRDQDQPAFLLDAMNQTIESASQSRHDSLLINRLLRFADFRYHFYDQEDEPMRLYEEALERLRSADAAIQREFSTSKIEYTNKLAKVYFDLAVQEQKAGRDPSEPVTKLKQLATTAGFTADAEEVFSYYTPGYPSLLWGRWLRDYEHAETSVWRKCFRARILEQMKGLDDDDPTNDTPACRTLAISLFQAGDRKDAGALVAVLFKTLENYMAERERLKAAAAEAESQGDQDGDAETVVEAEQNPPNAETSETPTQETQDPPECNLEPSDPIIPPSLKKSPTFPVTERKHLDPTTHTNLPLHLASNAWNYTCDACGYDAEDQGSMFFCEVCYDTNFCEGCLEKVKTRSLTQRLCSPEHEWYRAWPLERQKVREMADEEGLVGVQRVEGEVVFSLRREWVEGLRERWLIE